MAEIDRRARRLSGMDWDNWPDASILPSGARPVIFETEDAFAVLYGSKRRDLTIVVGIGRKDEHGEAKLAKDADGWTINDYYTSERSAEGNSVGTTEQIEEEQTELFNNIVNDLFTHHDVWDIMSYYGV